MAIAMPDPYGQQEDVPLGQSQRPVRETYDAGRMQGAAANYEDAMRNANQLYSAVSNLSESFNTRAKEAQELNDKVAIDTAALADGRDGIVNSGGPGGALGGSFNLFGPSPVSPAAQMVIAGRKGDIAASQLFSTDPDLQKDILSNADIRKNPDALNSALDKWWQSKNGSVDNPYGADSVNGRVFGSHISAAFTKFKMSMLGTAADEAAKFNQGEAERAFSLDLAGKGTMNANRQTFYDAFKAAGVDPVKGMQFVGIEQEDWNKDARTGSHVGLGQYDATSWKNEVANLDPTQKAALSTPGGDPTNVRDTAIVMASEIKRNTEEARSVLGRDPTTAEVYMFHQFGAPEVAKYIISHPDETMHDALAGALKKAGADPAMADTYIRANPSVYQGGGMSVADTMKAVNGTMNAKSGMHYQVMPAGPGGMVTSSSFTPGKWYTSFSDFDGSGPHGSRSPFGLDSRIINTAEQISTAFGRKVGIVNAYRTPEAQAQVSTAGGTNHTRGLALDMDITDPKEQAKAAQIAASMGASGIEKSGDHFHFDFNHGSFTVFGDSKTDRSGDAYKSFVAAANAGNEQFKNGDAGYSRIPGFQGRPSDPVEADIFRARQQYGIPADRARALIWNSTVDRAYNMAFSGQAPEAIRSLQDYGSSFGALSQEDKLKLNEATQHVTELQTAIQNRDMQTQLHANQKASDDYIDQQAAALKADPNYRVAPPDRSQFKGHGAQEAYNAALAASAGIVNVNPQVSNGNLIQATSEVLGSPEQFANKLGIKDWGTATPSDIRNAVLTKMPGQFTPEDLNKLTVSYEQARSGASHATAQSDAQLRIYSEQLHRDFLLNDKAISAITEANNPKNPDNIAKAALGQATDPYNAQKEITKYQGMMDEFFKANLSARIRADIASNGGQQPSGERIEALADKAHESAVQFGHSLSNAIVNEHGDFNKANADASLMSGIVSPQTQQTWEAAVNSSVKQQFGGQYVATNIQFPNVPKGSFLLLGQDGKPQIDPNGMYTLFVGNDHTTEAKMPSFSQVPAGDYPQQVTGPEFTPPAPAPAPAPTLPPEQHKDEALTALNEKIDKLPENSPERVDLEAARNRHHAWMAFVRSAQASAKGGGDDPSFVETGLTPEMQKAMGEWMANSFRHWWSVMNSRPEGMYPPVTDLQTAGTVNRP